MIEGSPLATSHNIIGITWLILIMYNQFVNNVDCFDYFIILTELILPFRPPIFTPALCSAGIM